VLLADDHLLVRDGLKRVVNEQPDMDVIAEAGEGREAGRLAQNHAPDIALLDVSMPGWAGVTLAQEMTRTCPQVRIIAVTRHDDEGFLTRMLNAGAHGYVLKQSPSAELVRAIRAVAQGQQHIDSAVRRHVSEPPPPTLHNIDAAVSEPLTSLEEDVLRLVAATCSNQGIAELLTLPVEEVASLKRIAMRKTGLVTRLQVISFARSLGWDEHAGRR
jgi:DNA-binding NarL/FixJ family response regulator